MGKLCVLPNARKLSDDPFDQCNAWAGWSLLCREQMVYIFI
jgi:hypothetical protein